MSDNSPGLSQKALDVLKKYWGYESFRPLQKEIIESVTGGNHTLALMPTGGGKSITFQVPALLSEGLTLVITPLVSLMKDQVDNLKKRGIGAAALHAGMTLRERNLVFDKARLKKIKLLYVSPERLGNESFKAEIRNLDVRLLAVDEAHCISQWGYDFRPSYLKISSLTEIFPSVTILALTASATPIVVHDIIDNLKMGSGVNKFALSFHRHNLSYVVRLTNQKDSKLLHALSVTSGSAIVFVRSRKETSRISSFLNENGISSTFYHAGLRPEEKEMRQNAWMRDEIRVMVATNAFGMGIDKPDVRLVAHMDIPPSLEEYYQEAGRAGRDSKKSYALLLASRYDKRTLTRRLNAAFPPEEVIKNVYEKACVFAGIAVSEGYNSVHEFNLDKFCALFKFDVDQVKGAFTILANAGYIVLEENPYSKSRVYFLATRDELYNCRLSVNEQKTVNALLRMYTALFADYVYIDEETIASNFSMTREEVYENLLTLSQKKIIHYIPKSNLPYIYLPTAREQTKYITLGDNVYKNRRELMKDRLDTIRDFVYGAEKCRDKVLLEYFGEENPCDCGICDICVDRKKSGVRTEDELEKLILDYIQNNHRASLDNLTSVCPSDSKRVIDVAYGMLKAGKIERQGKKLIVKS